MTTLWLVYERDSVERNAFFIQKWRDAAAARGVGIYLVTRESLTVGILEGSLFIQHEDGLPQPDAAVMRLNDPLLSRQFELLGVPAFNNAEAARVFNDKRLTHQMLCGLCPMMDTVFLRGDEIDAPFPYPIVVKGVHGCGGRQVYLVHNDEEFRAALQSIRPDDALAQPLCDTPGRDVRAYVLGGNILRVMMRVSGGDFRSNIGQGGAGVPYELGKKETGVALQIARRFDAGLIGVDFIFHQGKLLLNEVEDAVGTRMLYATGCNPVPEYLGFILSRLSGRVQA